MAPGTTRSTSRKTKINSKKRKLDDIEGEEVSKTALANIQEESKGGFKYRILCDTPCGNSI